MLFKVERCVIGTVLSTTEPLQAYVSLMIAECILILVRSAVAGRQEMRLHFSNSPPLPFMPADRQFEKYESHPWTGLKSSMVFAECGYWIRGFVESWIRECGCYWCGKAHCGMRKFLPNCVRGPLYRHFTGRFRS